MNPYESPVILDEENKDKNPLDEIVLNFRIIWHSLLILFHFGIFTHAAIDSYTKGYCTGGLVWMTWVGVIFIPFNLFFLSIVIIQYNTYKEKEKKERNE